MEINLLQKIYAHPLVDDNALQQIAAMHYELTLKKGNIILREGHIMQDYYLLEQGVMRAFVHDYDNNEITTEFFTTGDIVIVPSSLFQQRPSAENLQAICDCKLKAISIADFQRCFHEFEGFREWGRNWFSQQVFVLKQRALDMVMKPASQRYKELLLSRPDILKYTPLKQIASYLGITDSSLSRIRKEMAKHEWKFN